MVMVATIALHGAVIAALMAMRIIPDVLNPPPPLVTTIEQAPELQPPPPEDLKVPVTSMRFDVPVIPEVVIPEMPASESALVQPEASTDTVVGVPEGTGTNVVAEVPATPLQFRATRPADDYYPAASLRLQEEGIATVRVCVGPNGRMDGAPVIEQSAGSARLDAAALTWAREALRFTPATRNGQAVAACKGFRVNFRLR
jgi:protein TonB